MVNKKGRLATCLLGVYLLMEKTKFKQMIAENSDKFNGGGTMRTGSRLRSALVRSAWSEVKKTLDVVMS